MRTTSLFAVLFLCAAGAADDPKPDDPIAAELLKGKEAYVASVERAKAEVLKTFDRYFDSVKKNGSLKIEAQLAQLQKIEAEKKAFDESGVPPALPGMKVALSEYRVAQKKAEAVCKAAFEKAAKAYRDKGDVKAAVAVLDEMKEFLARTPGADGAVVIASALSPTVLAPGRPAEEGAKVLTADYVKGDAAQLWKVVPAGDGWAYIEHIKTGLVVTVSGRGNGAEAHLAKKRVGFDGQLWKLPPVATHKDTVKIVNKGSDRILAVAARVKGPGVRIILWDDRDDGPPGRFTFAPPK